MLRPYVTGSERARLKAAVDRRQRELVLVGSARGSCVACGVPFDRFTSGCRSCQARRQNRRYRSESRARRKAKHD